MVFSKIMFDFLEVSLFTEGIKIALNYKTTPELIY